MKRAEMRRAKKDKEKDKKVYNLTLQEIRAIKQQATEDAIDTSFKIMLAMPFMVLRDKWGFGNVRLTRFMEQVVECYDSFLLGYISLDDLIKQIRKETGVDLIEEAKKEKKLF